MYIILADGIHLKRILEAKEAVYDEGKWNLVDVDISTVEADQTSHTHIPSHPWNTSITPDYISLNLAVAEPHHLSIRELREFIQYNVGKNISTQRYNLAYWNKLLSPVITIGLAMLGIAFIFGPLRSVSIWFRIVMGSVTALSFKLAQELMGEMSVVFDLNPLLMVSLPTLFSLLISLHLLRKT